MLIYVVWRTDTPPRVHVYVEAYFGREYFSRTHNIVNSKLDGVGVSHADQHATPHVRKLMNEAEQAPMPESIRWTQTAHKRSAAMRRDRIAVLAYYMSEARGFAPGHEAEDWLLAQAQVDARDADTFEN